MKKFFAISIVLMAISAGVFAQATAQATATATIVTPITITKTTDMSFGNIIPSATLAGTVVLAPDGTPTYTNVTATALPSATATISAASFDVGGTPDATYAITLPFAALTLTGPGGATMTADTFTSNPGATGTLDGTGAEVLNVGATLNVAAAQAAGTYTSGNFDVTVNYN